MVFNKEWYQNNSHPRGMAGKTHSRDTKLKMSISSKGRPKSAEHRQNIRLSKTGVKCPWTSEWNKVNKPAQMRGNKNPSKRTEVKKLISRSNRGRVTSPNTLFMSGKLNPCWKDGRTTENQKIRASKRYCSWRKSVFERDDYTCRKCGSRNGNGKNVYLEAHHIKGYSKYQKLRFNIENGITHCLDCHKKTDSFGRNI